MGEAFGSTIELEPTAVAHGGVFVARYEGRVVFVSDTVIGERVRARITDDSKQSFWRAETVEVLEGSPQRRDHVWSEAHVEHDPLVRPGGAEFGHITLRYQRELKRQVLSDSLDRMAGYRFNGEVEVLPGDDHKDGLGWRTRIRAHVADDGSVGPYAARSHRVVPVTSIPLATSGVAHAVLRDRKLPAGSHIDVVESDNNITVLVGRRGQRGRREAHPIVERVGEREFHLDASSFWQVHHTAATTLSHVVGEVIDGALFTLDAANLDLYGGVGLLAAAVGERFGSSTHITSVETDTEATNYAALNLADWIGATTVKARVDQYLDELLKHAPARERSRLASGTVVLDPPRSGAGKVVVHQLCLLKPAQIIYIACDPVAFARDMGLFRTEGYELANVRAFDLFPHTHHVESIGVLKR